MRKTNTLPFLLPCRPYGRGYPPYIIIVDVYLFVLYHKNNYNGIGGVVLNTPNTPGISPEKLNLLLNLAGKKLGQSPEQLKKQLASGNMDGLMAKLNPQAKDQLGKLMQNPQGLEALLRDEKIKSMLAGLIGQPRG